MSSSGMHEHLREAVADLCSRFTGEYWRKVDEAREYPEEFVKALTEAGWLSALIPEEYGGSGLGITEASIILEAVNRSGGNSGACHAQMYIMGTLLAARLEGAEGGVPAEDRQRGAAPAGVRRHRAEHRNGHHRLKTTAVRKGDRYVVNGQKVFISRVQHSDLMTLLVRTTPLDQVKKKSDGMSVLLVDLREAIGHGITVRPIQTMMNHETNELFIDDLEVPVENLIGEEGKGFRYILDGMNAERILIAAECVGDGYWFIERAKTYAKDRVVFDRPIGQNQGVQFPIARAYVNVEAANLMRFQAAALVRRREAVRGGGQHGQAPGGRRFLGGGQRGDPDPRGFRIRRGIRHRAEVPGDPAVPGGSHLHEPDPLLRGRARTGTCRGPSDAAALDGITVVFDRTRGGGAVRDPPDGGSGRPGHQGGASRRRGFRPLVRRDRCAGFPPTSCGSTAPRRA